MFSYNLYIITYIDVKDFGMLTSPSIWLLLMFLL